MRIRAITIFVIALTAISASAQDTKTEKEIKRLRAEIVAAIKEKNRKFLDSRLADGFTHTHASGTVDDKQARIAMLVSDSQTIDALDPESISIKAFGTGLAVAQGRTKTKEASPKTYQWTVVYQKTKGIWLVMLSHASPVVL